MANHHAHGTIGLSPTVDGDDDDDDEEVDDTGYPSLRCSSLVLLSVMLNNSLFRYLNFVIY